MYVDLWVITGRDHAFLVSWRMDQVKFTVVVFEFNLSFMHPPCAIVTPLVLK